MLQTLGEGMNLVTHAPVHRLHLSTGLQVDDTMREEVEHFLTDLFGIVPVLKHITRREVVPDIIEVLHQLVGVLIGLEFLRHLWQ